MNYFDQFSIEQIKKQYAKCATGLEVMVERSKKSGKYNGYTTSQLKKKVIECKSKSI